MNQITSTDVDILHHLGLIGHSMQAMIATYERLGFIFSPLSLPKIPIGPENTSHPIGVGNRCAIFQNNYLEMLAVVDAKLWGSISTEQRGPFNIDFPLSRYEGLHVLHLGTDNLEAVRERLVETGLEPSPIRPFQRVVDTENGPQTMCARTLSFPPGSNPEALLQIAQHETPELVLQPRYMSHPNGAKSITEVIICTQEPDRLTEKYEHYSGKLASHRDGFNLIDLGMSRILIASPTGINNLLPGIGIPTLPFLAAFTVSADLDCTEKVLKASGVQFQYVDDRILVHSDHGYGCAIVFEPLQMIR